MGGDRGPLGLTVPGQVALLTKSGLDDNADQEATETGITEAPLEDPPDKLQPSEMV